MAFKPNYGRDRAERAREARAKIEEKQRKKDEKTALRKAAHAGSQTAGGWEQSLLDEKQSDASKQALIFGSGSRSKSLILLRSRLPLPFVAKQ